MTRPIVLILARYFLPGHKAGGQLRTITNMIDQLSVDVDFRTITSDRDISDNEPYPSVKTDMWLEVRGTPVWYASPPTQTLRRLAALIRATPHDILYLNSYFDPGFTMRPLIARRLGLIPQRPTVLAPRGEFTRSALAHATKQTKKIVYRKVASSAGFHRGLIWQASSEYESREIMQFIGASAREIVVAADLPARASPTHATAVELKRASGDPLRVCFISRISSTKNLDFALEVLAKVRVPVVFDIYGPTENAEYWETCQRLIQNLPRNVSASYHGDLRYDEVVKAFATHDLFLFPTKGENFGHVIIESMTAGTPVLIANTTPWRDLEAAGVGWDLPLDVDAFARAIETAHAMGPAEYHAWRQRVAEYGARRSVDPNVLEANRQLFLDLVGR